MKKIALVLPVCALASTVAMADSAPIKIFAGANVAYNSVSWDKEITDNTDFTIPEDYLGMGAQLGIKYAPDQIYNFGLTFAYDYIFDMDAEIKEPAKPYVREITSGFSDIGITFDNYIRFSNANNKRADFVIGIGFARVTERFEITPTTTGYLNGLTHEKGTDEGGAFVLKLGYNQQITENIDFFTDLRVFDTRGDVESITNLSAGFKYNF